ncbi:hypothetical protein D3C80_1907610 [compost metagenome]
MGRGDRLRGRVARQQQHELVAGQASDQILRAQMLAQPACDFAQQGVACGMAVAVVDELEAVQVDEQQCGLRLLGLAQGLQCVLGAVGEQRAVG